MGEDDRDSGELRGSAEVTDLIVSLKSGEKAAIMRYSRFFGERRYIRRGGKQYFVPGQKICEVYRIWERSLM